jgi:hypothetical protein
MPLREFSNWRNVPTAALTLLGAPLKTDSSLLIVPASELNVDKRAFWMAGQFPEV